MAALTTDPDARTAWPNRWIDATVERLTDQRRAQRRAAEVERRRACTACDFQGHIETRDHRGNLAVVPCGHGDPTAPWDRAAG